MGPGYKWGRAGTGFVSVRDLQWMNQWQDGGGFYTGSDGLSESQGRRLNE